MGHLKRNTFLLIVMLAVPFEAITVSPSLCPTNKIAPHKRIASWKRPSSRTFAAYYDLFTPNAPQSNPQQNPLQEQLQEDDADDCGDIENYDENDLSSVSHQNRRRQDRVDNRFLFGGIFNRPPQQQTPQQRPPLQEQTTSPLNPSTRPPRPQRPSHNYPPLRPPYWSGGLFSNNQYQPPSNEDPSDHYKPAHEPAHYSDAPQTYRPGVVGGPIGHVVGVTQVRPTTTPTPNENTRRKLAYYSNLQPHSTPPTIYSTRRPRTRNLNSDSVIGSFIDLLFK